MCLQRQAWRVLIGLLHWVLVAPARTTHCHCHRLRSLLCSRSAPATGNFSGSCHFAVEHALPGSGRTCACICCGMHLQHYWLRFRFVAVTVLLRFCWFSAFSFLYSAFVLPVRFFRFYVLPYDMRVSATALVSGSRVLDGSAVALCCLPSFFAAAATLPHACSALPCSYTLFLYCGYLYLRRFGVCCYSAGSLPRRCRTPFCTVTPPTTFMRFTVRFTTFCVLLVGFLTTVGSAFLRFRSWFCRCWFGAVGSSHFLPGFCSFWFCRVHFSTVVLRSWVRLPVRSSAGWLHCGLLWFTPPPHVGSSVHTGFQAPNVGNACGFRVAARAGGSNCYLLPSLPAV